MNPKTLKSLFGISLLFTFGAMIALAQIDVHLRNPGSPLGIVSFELCAYQNTCQSIVGGWSPYARLMAAFSLGVDYLFMVAYPASLCLALLLLAPSQGRLAPATRWVAGLAWLAGLADALENYALSLLLLDPAGASGFAWLASGCASVKFFFVLLCLLWLPACWLLLRWRSR